MSVEVFRETWMAKWDFYTLIVFLVPIYFYMYLQPYLNCYSNRSRAYEVDGPEEPTTCMHKFQR